MAFQTEKDSRELPIPIDSFSTDNLSQKVTNNVATNFNMWVSLSPNHDMKCIKNLILNDPGSHLSKLRINISKFSSAHLNSFLNEIEILINESSKNITVCLDTGGPKIRTEIKKYFNKDYIDIFKDEDVFIVFSKQLKVSRTELFENKNVIPINGKIKNLKPDEIIFISDGWQQLKVVEIKQGQIRCQALHNIRVYDMRGVYSSSFYMNLDPIISEEIELLDSLNLNKRPIVDTLCLSFCKNDKDIESFRDVVNKIGFHGNIMAKVETLQASKNIQSIVEKADCIMIGRGDLAVDLAAHNKNIIDIEDHIRKVSAQQNKDCIIATRIADSLEDPNNNSLNHLELTRLKYELSLGYPCIFLLANETYNPDLTVDNYILIIKTVKSLISEKQANSS
jgi:pyruvate kinase